MIISETFVSSFGNIITTRACFIDPQCIKKCFGEIGKLLFVLKKSQPR